MKKLKFNLAAAAGCPYLQLNEKSIHARIWLSAKAHWPGAQFFHVDGGQIS
jgi:hypothetical protein